MSDELSGSSNDSAGVIGAVDVAEVRAPASAVKVGGKGAPSATWRTHGDRNGKVSVQGPSVGSGALAECY